MDKLDTKLKVKEYKVVTDNGTAKLQQVLPETTAEQVLLASGTSVESKIGTMLTDISNAGKVQYLRLDSDASVDPNVTILPDAAKRFIVETRGKYDATNNKIVTESAVASAISGLASESFVNSSIATATATFRGTFIKENGYSTIQSALDAITTKDLNDYMFYRYKDSSGNTWYSRYKYDGTKWVYEYDLNNSSFTAEQFAAVNSGATADKINSIANKINSSDLADWAKADSKPTYTASEVGALTKTDADGYYQAKGTYLTSHQDISGKANKSTTTTAGNYSVVSVNTDGIVSGGGTIVEFGSAPSNLLAVGGLFFEVQS